MRKKYNFNKMYNEKNQKVVNKKEAFEKIEDEKEKKVNVEEYDSQQIEELIHTVEKYCEDIPIPESLMPEHIKNQLLQKKRKTNRHFAEIAAAIALVIIVGGAGVYHRLDKDIISEKNTQIKENIQEDGCEQNTFTSMEGKIGHAETIGRFRLAKSYDEIYKTVKKNNDKQIKQNSQDMGMNILEEVQDSADVKSEVNEKKAYDFSKKNVQVEGIDESDFVKNDYDNLFVQDQDKVSIIDTSANKMKIIATIKPELKKTDTIREMYMDKERVVLIIERIDEDNLKNDPKKEVCCDKDFIPTEGKVILKTYDIKDRTHPKLRGIITIDGLYMESRKNNDIVTIFTNKALNVMEKQKNNNEDLIPRINGSKLKIDSIYLAEEFQSEMVAVSINIKEPDKQLDQIAIMNDYANVYMSDDAIYLYQNVVQDDVVNTEITKFRYVGGYFGTGNVIDVKGRITDTFAISEKDGILRVLTTIWNKDESTNELHLYDRAMNEMGSLKNLAKGEEIYAARYIGNIAYFITYHNTDPLFAVDISNPQRPEMLGNVKMTGYSDYLHPYGENLLLGIGYETDPDTSESLGVKMTMYDISDPLNLKILDNVVLKNVTTEAAYNYKTILADGKKNLIGFGVDGMDNSSEYLVYRWENNHFVNMLTQKMKDVMISHTVRACYARDRFYCIFPNGETYKVMSFDIKNDFVKLDEIKL